MKKMRTLRTLHQSLKEICSKRIGFDKLAFSKASGEVFPFLKALWEEEALRGTNPQLVTILVKAMHR